MAISVVQVSATVTGDNVASLASASTDWTSNIGSGNTIILVVYGFDNDATGLTFTASWSAGGNFTESTSRMYSAGNNRYTTTTFYLHNAGGSGTKPTATVTPSQAAYFNFAMLEVSGLANAAEETENSNISGTSTTSAQPGAITTAGEALVVVGYVGEDGNPQNHTFPAGYTEFGEQTDNSNHQAGTCGYQIFTDPVVNENPSITTTNSDFAAVITAWAAGAGGGGATVPLPNNGPEGLAAIWQWVGIS